MAAFAASLIETTKSEWWDEEGQLVGLRLPLGPPGLVDVFRSGWGRVTVEMHGHDAVRIENVHHEEHNWWSTQFVFREAMPEMPLESQGCAEVVNASQRYARQQRELSMRRAQLQQAAAAGVPPPQLTPFFRNAFSDLEDWDSEAYAALAMAPVCDTRDSFEKRWRELRDRATADVAAALAAMLQRAISYRGRVRIPRPAPPPQGEAGGAAGAAAEEEMGDA